MGHWNEKESRAVRLSCCCVGLVGIAGDQKLILAPVMTSWKESSDVLPVGAALAAAVTALPEMSPSACW